MVDDMKGWGLPYNKVVKVRLFTVDSTNSITMNIQCPFVLICEPCHININNRIASFSADTERYFCQITLYDSGPWSVG